MSSNNDDYLCVGICMADPDSGYCLGCGRPPLPVAGDQPAIVAEVMPPAPAREEAPAASPASPPGQH
ncbi:MAG: DUF1289 domain-containing protein [Candidatus Accumulibacter sp.]|uniref:DUF1289 domain-containing protein n=1 Tax=Accumulibacter sp. TaxID=2053492 RepID=UPI00287AC6F8|nr:DUF1289 domain-containing protein [Accumulibacter sp.]MDS4015398.1 DUF1289 domain-containing protein [Accumulibacter sp.]